MEKRQKQKINKITLTTCMYAKFQKLNCNSESVERKVGIFTEKVCITP